MEESFKPATTFLLLLFKWPIFLPLFLLTSFLCFRKKQVSRKSTFFDNFHVGGHRGSPIKKPENTIASMEQVFYIYLFIFIFEIKGKIGRSWFGWIRCLPNQRWNSCASAWRHFGQNDQFEWTNSTIPIQRFANLQLRRKIFKWWKVCFWGL